MIRHVEGGFKEQCEAIDDDNQILYYTLLESPAPFSNYRAKIKLKQAGTDSCEIEWSSTFQPLNMPEKDVVKIVEDMYESFIGNIFSILNQ